MYFANDIEWAWNKDINILGVHIYKSKNVLVFSFDILLDGRKEFLGLNDLFVEFVAVIDHFLRLSV